MPTDASNHHLLQAICELLPAEDRERIRAMDPTDYITFVEAYCAARDLPEMSAPLRQAVTLAVCHLMDAETAEFVRTRALSQRKRGTSGEGDHDGRSVIPMRRRSSLRAVEGLSQQGRVDGLRP